MSDALINKYRPQTWKDVIGQEKIAASMENSIKKRKSQAYLLVGPPGTGKTTMARLGKAELKIRNEDWLDVDAATNTGIEEMRLVMSDLQYKPLGGNGTKGILVDECHMLSKQAITSLLKTLEEPPKWVFWFLCTTDEKKIPAAIKTRCATYHLKEIRGDDLFQMLANTDEARDLKDEVLDVCVEEAGGSARQALSNLAVCLTAKNADDAADLLRSASKSAEAIDLARALMQGKGWRDVKPILVALKDQEVNPESVRHTIRAYMTSVILGKGGNDKNAFGVLSAFSQPFNSGDGISPLVLACGKIVFGDDDVPF